MTPPTKVEERPARRMGLVIAEGGAAPRSRNCGQHIAPERARVADPATAAQLKRAAMAVLK